ncbi:MAG: hypothetical protein IJX47_06405 [Clostridia bacterium]|nr:hypothetical protein [Clostridia bacterium]
MREFLIKTFSEEKYAHALIENGELLFRHVSYFREYEEKEVRGDIREGEQCEKKKITISPNVKHFNLGTNFVLDWESVKRDHPEFAQKENATYDFSITYVVDCQIYCMTYVKSGLVDIDGILDNVKSFGEYSAVICDCKDFLDKLRTRLPSAKYGLVSYSDAELRDMFIKPSKYKNQNEFRIMDSSNNAKSRLIAIGKLNGFVCKSKSLAMLKQFL